MLNCKARSFFSSALTYKGALFLLFLLLFVSISLNHLFGVDATVSNNTDSDPGSLRAAFNTVNGGGAANNINVNSDYAITLLSNLPTLIKNTSLKDVPFTISGSVTFSINSGITLTFDQSDTSSFAGIMNGAGSVVKSGGNALTLTGKSTYTGGTTFNDGSVLITDDTNLGGASGPLTFGGGILNINNASYSSSRGITLNASGGTLKIISGTSTLSGTITGAGKLSKFGDGTLVLTGSNNYSGGTTVSDGVLQGNSSSLQGDITNNTSVIFNQTSSGTYAGKMDGSGKLTKSGAGTLVLSGANSYSGGTTVSAGALQGDSASLQGSITNNAVVVFNQGAAGTYSGTLSGSGSVTKTGAGTLTFSGANSYSGGTTVSLGILQGTSSSLQGNIRNNAVVIFNQGFTGTYSGNMSGSGSLTKLGTGTTILSGTNSYSEGTTVTAGTLQGTTKSLQRTITNNAAVIFNQGFDGTYAGTMGGTGTLQKAGGGKVSFSGIVGAASTTVSGGGLFINGALTSPVVAVNSGGELGGRGTITGDVTNNGTLSPGASVGILTIVGNYIHGSGATLNTEITPTTSDLLNVTGTITINGGTVNLLPQNVGTRYGSSTLYTIAHADGGVTGTFNGLNISDQLPLFSGSLSYLPLDVQMQVVVSPFSDVVKDGNPGVVAKYLDTFDEVVIDRDLDYVLSRLQLLNLEDLKDALNLLQPAQYKGLILSQENNALLVESSLRQRVEELYKTECTRCVECTDRFAVWGAPYGDVLSLRGKKRFVGFDAKSMAFVLGGDYALKNNLYLGLLTGYSRTTLSWNRSAGRADTNSYYGGLYGTWFKERYFINGSVIGGWSDYDASRRIQFTGVDRKARTDHRGSDILGHFDGGWIFCRKELELRPFLGLDYLWLKQKGFSETGAKSINLKVDESDYSMLRSELGLKVANCWRVDDCFRIVPDFKLSWVYENRFDGKNYTARFKGVGGSFTVKGLNPNRSLIATGFGLTARTADGTASLSIRYDGEFGSNYHDNRGQLEFIYSF